MGASTSSERNIPIEQREAETLAASTGALSVLQKAFSKLAESQSNAIAVESLQKCFGVNSKDDPVSEGPPIPDSFPAVLDHLGSSIVELCFVKENEGVDWVEFVKGYNSCCARKPLSLSITALLRVFSVAMKKAGLTLNLEFESDENDCKVSGWLMPVDVLMLLWVCWAMSWSSRVLIVPKERVDFRLPDVKNIVLSVVESCAEGESGVNVWECDVSGLEVKLHVGKFVAWVLSVVPSLPDCFTQFVYAKLKYCASEEAGLECSASSAPDALSTVVCSPNLLSNGVAWAISLTLTGPLSEEILGACFPSDADEVDDNLLYRSALHGRGMNRFWSNVEGYQGPLLILIAATSVDGSANERHWVVGVLTHQGFESRDLFYGSSGNLYALSPVFHVYPPTGKERNFVYSHLHPSGRVYEAKPKPVGIAFGGSIGNERIFVDEDFSRVTIRHHAADKTYHSGSLFPDQGFLAVDALISGVEVWGLGGKGAKGVQDSYKKREQLFNDQRRKIDLKTFANWEDSPEKMMMDMVSNPNAVRREER